jgi:hypothetical protein
MGDRSAWEAGWLGASRLRVDQQQSVVVEIHLGCDGVGSVGHHGKCSLLIHAEASAEAASDPAACDVLPPYLPVHGGVER